MKKFTIAMLLIAAPLVAQTTPTVPPIVGMQVPSVFDADGKALGALVAVEDNDGTGAVLFKLADPDAAITLKIKRRGADVVWGSVPAFFSESDCRGMAAVAPSISLSDFAAVVDADQNLHIADMVAAVPSTSFPYRSQWTSTGDCFNSTGGGISGAIVMTKKLKLSDHFKTPLRVDNLHKQRTRSVAP